MTALTWRIAFAFGLVHGFGFANVLSEMDLPARAFGWSPAAFNIGVQAGQLLVVAAAGSPGSDPGTRRSAGGWPSPGRSS
jgi:hypothetical protein